MPSIEKCANCDEILNAIELQAKYKDQATEWCCYECYGDGSDENFTTYGKYILLLKFTKKMAIEGQDRDVTMEIINEEAQELLKEIGEFTK